MAFFVRFNLLLGFLRKFFKNYLPSLSIGFVTTPPPSPGFVNNTLHSGAGIWVGVAAVVVATGEGDLANIINSFTIQIQDIENVKSLLRVCPNDLTLNFFSDQIQHIKNMENLAEHYYNYVSNKVNSTISTNIISLKDSYYDLSNLKPIKGFNLNDPVIFTHTPHPITMVSSNIKYVKFCIQYSHSIFTILGIFFALRLLFNTFEDMLAILSEVLLNLSKFFWHIIINKILLYIEYMKKIYISIIMILQLKSNKGKGLSPEEKQEIAEAYQEEIEEDEWERDIEKEDGNQNDVDAWNEEIRDIWLELIRNLF
jgi:hypothetical protein